MSYTERALTRMTTPAAIGTTAGAPRAGVAGPWMYRTDDAAAAVEAGGYFNNARGRLVVGDLIFASMVLAGTPVAKTYVVTAAPKTGNVTIALAATAAG